MSVQETKKSMLKELKKLTLLWPYIKTSKLQLVIVTVLIPAIAGISMLQPFLFQKAIDDGIVQGNTELLMGLAGIFFATVLAEYLFRAGQGFMSAVVVYRMTKILRNKLVRHVLRLNCSYHDEALSGALVTRATSDFDNLGESLNSGVLRAVVDVFTLMGTVVGMFLLNWKLAFIAVVVLPIAIFIIRWFSSKMKGAMLDARKIIAKLNGFTQECLYGNATIKLLGAGDDCNRKYRDMSRGYRNKQFAVVVYDAFLFSVLDGVSVITVGLVLWYAISNLSIGAGLSAGVLVAFVRYVQQMFDPLKQLGSTMAMLQGVFTSIDRIFGVLDTHKFIGGEDSINNIKGRIRFEDVNFSYDEKEEGKKVLNDINFDLSPRQSLALVGSTGSGKSTIIKLLSKLYDGYQGKIYIDDYEISHLDEDQLRRKISIVPQDIVLFEGSLRFNITLGDENDSDEQVWEACRQVGAEEFIKTLPGQLDFEIKEQGSNLSHGQKQLLVFARALVRDPMLVILDEATSSVDPKSEQIIQNAIAKILEDRTVVIIAHRISTIRECDKIIVLDQGKIVEEGKHQELLALDGFYTRLNHMTVHA